MAKIEFNIFPEKVKWQPHLAFISLSYSRYDRRYLALTTLLSSPLFIGSVFWHGTTVPG